MVQYGMRLAFTAIKKAILTRGIQRYPKIKSIFGGVIMKTKRIGKSLVFGVVVLSIVVLTQFAWVGFAAACGWGQSGGGDYVPQRRGNGGFLAQKSAVTEDQARDIVTGYVKRLNPDLEIGKVKDNGGFYEVEILSQSQEIVQLLGVDKRSGRLLLLN